MEKIVLASANKHKIEEFNEILTLWRNNAILLGSESDRSRVNTDISEINQLAELLGIQLRWQGEQPWTVPNFIGELLIMVAREAIANAVKHAEAKNITIEIYNFCITYHGGAI